MGFLLGTVSSSLLSPSGQLILDRLSELPFAAYSSFRKLRAEYTGPCLEVRRDNDDARLDIGFVDDLLDESALLSFVGGNSAFIRSLYNQGIVTIGVDRDLHSFPFAEQPQIVDSGVILRLGGNASIHFQKDGDVLFSDNLSMIIAEFGIYLIRQLERPLMANNVFDFNLNFPESPMRVALEYAKPSDGAFWDAGNTTTERLFADSDVLDDLELPGQITLLEVPGTNGQKIRLNGSTISQKTPGTPGAAIDIMSFGRLTNTIKDATGVNQAETIIFRDTLSPSDQALLEDDQLSQIAFTDQDGTPFLDQDGNIFIQ